MFWFSYFVLYFSQEYFLLYRFHIYNNQFVKNIQRHGVQFQISMAPRALYCVLVLGSAQWK